MTDLLIFLSRKPWWTSRYMWGSAVAEALVLDAIWHSRFTFADLHDAPLEAVLS